MMIALWAGVLVLGSGCVLLAGEILRLRQDGRIRDIQVRGLELEVSALREYNEDLVKRLTKALGEEKEVRKDEAIDEPS